MARSQGRRLRQITYFSLCANSLTQSSPPVRLFRLEAPRLCPIELFGRPESQKLGWYYSYPNNMSMLRGSRPLASKFSTSSSVRIVRPYSVATSNSYEHLLISTPKAGVGLSKSLPTSISDLVRNITDVWSLIVTLNRPKALNALSSAVFVELNDALRKLDQDKDTGAIVITGSEKAFAGMTTVISTKPHASTLLLTYDRGSRRRH